MTAKNLSDKAAGGVFILKVRMSDELLRVKGGGLRAMRRQMSVIMAPVMRGYRKLFDVSDKTARTDLKDMERRGHIIFVGSKKTGYYILKLPDKLPDKNEKDNKENEN